MFTFKGSNAARAKQLAAKKKKPKFALGQISGDGAGLFGELDLRPFRGT